MPGPLSRLGWIRRALSALAAVAAVAPVSLMALPGLASTGSRDAVPPYYIAETGTKVPYPEHPDVAGIYSTATGTLLRIIRTPGRGQSVAGVSAAADDRTFAIATEKFRYRTLPVVRIYLVRLTVRDHRIRQVTLTNLALLTVPAGASFDAFALSPDGRKLAVADEPNGNASRLTEKLKVLDLRSDMLRTWTSSRGTIEGDTADPWSLSWAANNKTLAFNWYGFDPAHTGPGLLPSSGLRLLNTGRPAGQLVADSRLAVRFYRRDQTTATSAGYLTDIAMITPDGSTVVAGVMAFHGPDGGFAEFSATTGKLLRRMDWEPFTGRREGGPTDVLWAAPAGRALVVYAPPGHSGEIGILRGNRLALLPLPARAGTFLPGAAW